MMTGLHTGETMDTPITIQFQIAPAIERLLTDRRILVEDLRQTVHHAETTGEKFINPTTGRSLAFFRPERVTYWVEYSRMGDDYQIHSAYSHRMEMKRG